MIKKTLRSTLLEFSDYLKSSNVDSPRLSAEIILAYSLGIDRNSFLLNLIKNPDSELSEESLNKAFNLIKRRALGEPVAYIVGHKEFYGRDFLVSSATLIPRPDTETIIELSLKFNRKNNLVIENILDLGTGSGCIGITLALEIEGIKSALLVDKSLEAIGIAKKNANLLKSESSYFVCADFNTPVCRQGVMQLVVSNPPYISSEEYDGLSKEVKSFEPYEALVPKTSIGTSFFGDDDYLSVIKNAEWSLCKGGLLLMEIGMSMGFKVLEKLNYGAWDAAFIEKDLSGRDRIVGAIRC